VKRQLTAVLACLCLAAPAWAANGNILITFDQAGALCQQAVPCGMIGTIYVYGLLQGSSGSGITGAEYRIEMGLNGNADPGWFFAESFPMGTTTVGTGALSPTDPAPRGINVAWPSCQTGDGTKVLLETVQVLAQCEDPMTPLPELRLRAAKHSSSSNQFFQCPLFTLCDDPTFTKVCLGSNLTACRNPEPPFPNNATCSTSGEAWINPAPGRNCTVGVSRVTWSAVKGLYTGR